MSDIAALVDRYLATWNEPDAQRRRAAIDGIWTDDASYVDPLVVAEGRDAIDATIAAARDQFPGMTFRLAGPVDAHHNIARFTWTLGPDGGEPTPASAPIVGFDVAVVTDDGRLRAVHGFLDKVPAA